MLARLSGEGAAIEPAIDGPRIEATDERRCEYMRSIPRVICHAETSLAIATSLHDPVRMGCIRPKLGRMQAIAGELSRDPAEAASRSAEERIGSLSGEIERCADDETTLREDTSTVVRVAR